MQKQHVIIQLVIFLTVSSLTCNGFDGKNLMTKADSLFEKKKFSEARELYKELYDNGYYSRSTLLKMAYVHEGLGQNAQALFYLTAYFYQTEDPKAYEKIQVLADANNLDGYKMSDTTRVMIWINNRAVYVITLLSMAVLLCSIILWLAKRKNQNNLKLAIGFASLMLVGALFVVVNFVKYPPQALINKQTYLMSGPSAGANSKGMIPEGNLISVIGKQDVWLKVNWKDQEGFVKQNDLLLFQE